MIAPALTVLWTVLAAPRRPPEGVDEQWNDDGSVWALDTPALALTEVLNDADWVKRGDDVCILTVGYKVSKQIYFISLIKCYLIFQSSMVWPKNNWLDI